MSFEFGDAKSGFPRRWDLHPPVRPHDRLQRGDALLQVDLAAQVIILNGAPRSRKSSIASAIQNTFEGVWMNLGVDRFKQMILDRYQPGIGLRPGAEHPDLEPLVVVLYHALYEAIAAHSRLGLNVVVDAGYLRP